MTSPLHAVPETIHLYVFPQDYLDMVGLSAMFPRVEVFLIQGSPVDMLERPPMDGKRIYVCPYPGGSIYLSISVTC